MKVKINKENYNAPQKNLIRNKIIEIISERDINSILTLESPDFLFSKLLPEKDIIVFENDKKIFNDMKKKKPKNVNLFFGDVSDYSKLKGSVDCIYLDFCTNFNGAKETLFSLKDTIKKSKVFGITLSLWCAYAKNDGDYQFSIIKNIQSILKKEKESLEVIYGKAYKENKNAMTMVTILFEVKK